MKKFSVTALMFLLALAASARESGVEMADELRSSGKIYVVVAVIAVIMLGLLIYLFSIDRKVSKLERKG
jgi:hypothetical protein